MVWASNKKIMDTLVKHNLLTLERSRRALLFLLPLSLPGRMKWARILRRSTGLGCILMPSTILPKASSASSVSSPATTRPCCAAFGIPSAIAVALLLFFLLLHVVCTRAVLLLP